MTFSFIILSQFVLILSGCGLEFSKSKKLDTNFFGSSSSSSSIGAPTFTLGSLGSGTYNAGDSVALNLSGASGNIASYVIQYSTDGGATWSTLTTAPGNSTSVNVTVPNIDSPNAMFRVEALPSGGGASTTHTTSSFVITGASPTPPSVSVTGGTVTNINNSDITIASCTGIDTICIEGTGSQPLVGDGCWVPCSTVVDAFNLATHSVGSNTYYVWYKSSANNISATASTINITYDITPPTPVSVSVHGGNPTYKTAVPLTQASCSDIAYTMVKTAVGAPLASDPGWQTCSTSAGAIESDPVALGTHTLYVWFKDAASNVSTTSTDVSATYSMPTVSSLSGSAVTDDTPPLTINSCKQINSLYMSTSAAPAPTSGSPGWVSCTTMNNGLTSPTLALGANTVYTWLLYDDGTTVSVDYATTALTYSLPDSTPPAAVAVTLAAADPISVSRAPLTVSDCSDIDEVIVVEDSAVAPSNSDSGWVSCTTAVGGIESDSLSNGAHTLYVWFRDTSNNISTTSTDVSVTYNQTDFTPPDRPTVEVVGGPIITSVPARFNIGDCTDVDQVYINEDAGSAPTIATSGWQDCATAGGVITYNIAISDSYTVQVWFKDAAGNINATPRAASFVLDATPVTLPDPIAYWSMDDRHIIHSKVYDFIGGHHAHIYPFATTTTTGKVNQAISFNGTSTMFMVDESSDLRPTVGVTLSVWVDLVGSDGATVADIAGTVAGGDGYGLYLSSGNLVWTANGATAQVATTSYSSGWHHVVGTFDGQILKLYLDGVEVDTTDLGSPDFVNYACSSPFAIGGQVDCTANPTGTRFFNNEIDEVVVWDNFLTATQVYQLYANGMNGFLVNEDSVSPAAPALADISLDHDYFKTANITIADCTDIAQVFARTSTLPPNDSDSGWQPCSTIPGAFQITGLNMGSHNLKFWSKDLYGNVSAGYTAYDVAMTSTTTMVNPVAHYPLDNNYLNLTTIYEPYNDGSGLNVNATTGASGVVNEAFTFTSSSSHYAFEKYATHLQFTDEISIGGWFYLTNGVGTTQTLIGNLNGNYGVSLLLDGDLKFVVGTGASTREVTVVNTYYSTGWNHVVGVYDGQNTHLYVNRIQAATVNHGSVAPISYNGPLGFYLGAEANNNASATTNFYNSSMDEIMVFHDALTTTEVSNVFWHQNTIPPIPVPVEPKNNDYTIDVPLAYFTISTCDGLAYVYVSESNTQPDAEDTNWQTCNTTNGGVEANRYQVNASQDYYIWFKDPSEQVSTSATLVANVTYVDATTYPSPDSYWTMDTGHISFPTHWDAIGTNDAWMKDSVSITGVSRQGQEFVDTDQTYFRVDYDASTQPSAGVTLSAWIYPDAPANNDFIVGNYAAASNSGYGLYLEGGNLKFSVRSGGTTYTASSASAGLTAWSHIAGTFDGQFVSLYIDGALVDQANIGSAGNTISYSVSNAFMIGAEPGAAAVPSGDYYDGKIDEVAAWFGTALTPGQIGELYTQGQAGNAVEYVTTVPTDPVAVNYSFFGAMGNRAQITATVCDPNTFVYVSQDNYRPDENDDDWRECSTLDGAIYSEALRRGTYDAYVWLKSRYGQVSDNSAPVNVTINYSADVPMPLAHWTMDDADIISGGTVMRDRMGNFDATIQDATDTGGAAVYNESFDYNSGNYGYMNLDNTSLFWDDFDEFTVGGWIYLNVASTTGYIWGHCDNIGYCLGVSSGAPYFQVAKSSGNFANVSISAGQLTTGWHHIAGTFNQTDQTVTLYIDGLVASKRNDLTTYSGNQFEPKIGAGRNAVNTVSGSFNAKIDELKVWNQELTQEQLHAIYLEGAEANLYPADTTPPSPLPSVTLENYRTSEIHTDYAYFSVSSCSDILAVYINEGTRPNGFDDGWQICDTTRGSYRVTGITEGAHRFTFWFKDAANNVTTTSSDIDIEYVIYTLPDLPPPNAYWTMDANHVIGNRVRDMIGDAHMHIAGGTTGVAGQVNEAIQFSGSSDEFLLEPTYAASVEPRNEVTLSAWVYHDSTYTDDGTIISNQENLRNGFQLGYVNSGGWKVGIWANASKDNSSYNAMVLNSTITTGWHHFLGLYDGTSVQFFVDGVQVASSAVPFYPYSPILYLEQKMLNIGSKPDLNSALTQQAGRFFNNKIDDVALYPFALTTAQITELYNKGAGGNLLVADADLPTTMNNAFVSHYATIGSRARISIFDCTGADMILVSHSTVAPSSSSPDWQKCVTEDGAILSATLPNGTTYLRVWTRDFYGNVSASYAELEIDPIETAVTYNRPAAWWTMDSAHISGTTLYEYMNDLNGTLYNTPTTGVASLGKEGITFTRAQSEYMTVGFTPILRPESTGVTLMAWVEVDVTDTGSSEYILEVCQWEGLSFYHNTNHFNVAFQPNATNTPEGSHVYLTEITSGVHFFTSTFDGRYIKTYVDGQLYRYDDLGASYNNVYDADQALIYFSRRSGGDYFDGLLDEIIIFREALTQSQIQSIYEGFKKVESPSDSTPPTTTPNLSFLTGSATTDVPYTYLSVDSCTDIHAVYISLNNTPPLSTDSGWQYCSTNNGSLYIDGLPAGASTIYLWTKDQVGNVSAAPITTVVTYAARTRPDPVAYWPLDYEEFTKNRSYDLVSNLPAFHQGDLGLTAGQIDEGIDPNATDQFLEILDNSIWQPADEITISVWVNYSAAGGSQWPFLGTHYNTKGWYFGMSGGWLKFSMINGTTSRESFSDEWTWDKGVYYTDISNGWHHFVAVYDGRRAKVYVDGALGYEKDYGSYLPLVYNSGASLFVTADEASTRDHQSLTGLPTDDIAIWDRALTASEINDVFTSGVGFSSPLAAPNNPNAGDYTIEDYIGHRVILTSADCTNQAFILINDSAAVPSVNDDNWQRCNTRTKGLMSDNVASGANTLYIWAKNHHGVISSSDSLASAAPAKLDIPRPTAWWTLDTVAISGTTVYDVAGENDLTVYGSPATTTGVSGETFVFDNINDYAIVRGNGELSYQSELTLNAYAFLTQGDKNQNVILGNKLGVGVDAGITLQTYNGYLYAVAYTELPGSSTLSARVSTSYYASGWHMISATYDGSTIRLYIDASLVDMDTRNVSPDRIMHKNYRRWAVGAIADNGADTAAGYPASYFNGKLDEIMIYKEALSEAELITLYEYFYNKLYGADVTPPSDPGIYLVDGKTALSSPFATFTVPDCSDSPNVYISLTNSAPASTDSGWQACSQDQGWLYSPLLSLGTQDVYIWLKDAAGNVSGVITFSVTFAPDEIPDPYVYYTFDATENLHNTFTKDFMNRFPAAIYANATRALAGGVADEAIDLLDSGYVTGNSDLDVTDTDELTVSGWFKIDAGSGDHVNIAHQWEGGNNTNTFNLKVQNTGQLLFCYNFGGGYGSSTHNCSYGDREITYDNSWHHVAVIRNNRSVIFYLDGLPSSVIEIGAGNFINTNMTSLLEMGGQAVGSETYDGKLDEVAIWKTALTREQIQTVYYYGIQGDNLPVSSGHVPQPPPIPAHYWSFDDAQISSSTMQANFGGENLTFYDNGVITNVPAGVAGVIGEAVSLDGNDHFRGDQTFNLDNTWSIGGWVNTSALTGTHAIMSKWYSFDNSNITKNSFWLASNSSGYTYAGHNKQASGCWWCWPHVTYNSSALLLDPNIFYTGTWHYVTFTRNGRETMVYLDGVLVSQYTDGGGLGNANIQDSSATTSFSFGARVAASVSDFFSGNLDEFAVWDTTLTSEQINWIYQQNSAGRSISSRPILSVNGPTTVDYTNISLTVSDCSTYSDVLIEQTGVAPLDTDPDWVACSTGIGDLSETIAAVNGTYTIYAWFKTGAVVDGTPSTVDVTFSSADTTGPIAPGVTIKAGLTSIDRFKAEFTLSTCADIGGVYLSSSATPPTGQESSGWETCTTTADEYKSYVLQRGDNDIYFYFKDSVGNVTTGSSFTVTYLPPPYPRPIDYFAFEAAEQSGTNYTSPIFGKKFTSIGGHIPSSVSGQVGNAFDFDGNTDRLNYSYGAEYYLEDELTISTWVYVEGVTAADGDPIVSKWGPTASENEFKFVIDNDYRPCFYFQTQAGDSWGEAGYNKKCASSVLLTYTWYHLTVVRNAGSLYFYINGILDNTQSMDTDNFVHGTQSMEIAMDYDTSGWGFNGRLDELSIFNRALSTKQIEYIYSKNLYGEALYTSADSIGESLKLPYAYWSFDGGSLNDDIGSSHLTDAGTTSPASVAGKVGDAYDFEASNTQYFEDADFDSSFGTGGFSVSVWFKPESWSGQDIIIGNNYDISTANSEFFIGGATGNYALGHTWDGPSGWWNYTGVSTPTPTNWHHAVLVRDGEYLTMYVNGIAVYSYAHGNATATNNSPLGISIANDSYNQRFDGVIDEPAIWRGVLNSAQIQRLYLLGNAGTNINTTPDATISHVGTTVETNKALITVGDCSTYTHVLVNFAADGAPGAGDPEWVACSTATGAFETKTLSAGANAVTVWYKDVGPAVVGPTSLSITYTP